MPKYLFTSDQRISILPDRIKWVANYIQTGHSISAIVDKSDNNNATTLKFYYNLHSGTETCKRASVEPRYAIRNFVKKFQFPNTRTSESFNDSLSEEMLFAPFRSVVTILHLMAKEDSSGSSQMSLYEILYFLFCNPSIYKGMQVNYQQVILDIQKAREDGIDLEAKVRNVIDWRQYERQSRELVNVLTYASSCFKLSKNVLYYSIHSSDYEDDENFIKELISYNRFWLPTNANNFNLSNLEYISYMDTQNTPFQVIEVNPRLKTSISKSNESITSSCYSPFITAIRTKPFLLLAGISGTGKSRIVRELAFKSCPEYLQDKDGTTPGNYCMIEVKPNWHDSTELLGYYSNMNKSYQFKKFVKFLVKARMFPKVPFFVCLDEMNLAPVEHYFAEMLSIMETRKHPKIEGTDEVDKDVIKTGTIVDAQYFRELSKINNTRDSQTGLPYSRNLTDRDVYMKLLNIEHESDIDEEVGKRTDLTTEGLTLPDNVIIIGTVNMDDTTHQFSRKVIDRAMTIEMNGGKLSNMFGGSKDLEYLPKEEQEKWQNSFRQLYVNADEVLEAHPDEANDIMEKVPAKLENINQALKGTPFEVSYRVLNELTIMVGVLLDSKKGDESIDDIINQVLDRILLMKILPRIEGDSDMFNLSREFKQESHVEYNNRLEWLMDLAPEIVTKEQEGEDHRQSAREKIKEMMDRLENQEFTRFWP